MNEDRRDVSCLPESPPPLARPEGLLCCGQARRPPLLGLHKLLLVAGGHSDQSELVQTHILMQ